MSINVNGSTVDLPSDTRISLLDLLRDHLGLAGTKKGCNQGACGTCTVLVDGERILSCFALAIKYEGRSVTPIEGLSASGGLHPLQQAFIEHDGFQCGYCTPGQISSAVGMLSEVKTGLPSHVTGDLTEGSITLTRDELCERMSGNPVELHAATVGWDGDDLRVHDASQAVTRAAWSLAQVFDIEEKQGHVTSPYVGGGFGSKTLWQHQILAAAGSKLAGGPVRIMLSREGVYRIVGGGMLTEQRVALGAQADGGFDARIQKGVVAMGRHNNMPEPFILPAMSAYKSRSVRLYVDAAKMDTRISGSGMPDGFCSRVICGCLRTHLA